MNSKRLRQHLRGICAVLLVGGATSMLAAEPRLHERVVRGEARPRAEAPLLLVLPAQTPANALLDLRVMEGSQLLVRESVALPANIPDGATIDVLATHGQVLHRLRAMEAEVAGGLRLVAGIGGRTIADGSFGSADKRSPGVSIDTAVGEPREIEVRLDAKPRKTTSLDIDPACEDACYQQYLVCYDHCDERGGSCGVCSQEWQSCLYYCPQLCTEPKSVTTYSIAWPTGAAHFGDYTCASPFYYWNTGDLWERVYAYYTIYTYQRTEHCDGTYTDVLINTYQTSFWCSYDTLQQCSPVTAGVPYDTCP